MRPSTSTRLFASLLLLMLFTAAAAFAQITPSDDTYTLTTAPSTNYGSNGALLLQSGKASVFVRFDLNSIPPGYTDADIAKATLKLYVTTVGTPGSFNVNYVVGSWSEMTVTAASEPAIGAAIASGVNVTAANKDQYILVDVTAALGAWLDGSQANDGIALVANSPLNVNFTSKENTGLSHSPELDIVFTGAGPRGPQGFTGATGPAGAQGVQGPIGPMGVAGVQGPTGKTGTAGGRGPTGLQGATGKQGATGLEGPQGAAGATGAQGPIGLTGLQGPQGVQGAAGTNGTSFNFTGPFSNSTSYNVNDVTTYNGSTYLATIANQAAGTPDTNPTHWTLMAQQGAAGATGSQGPSGAQGPQGQIGLTGAIGTQGPPGTAGATGPQGPIGLTGAQGPQGAAGTNGTNGINGTGFNFRGAFNTSTAYAINDVVTYAPANITYNVNLTFGSQGSAVGTITTDGTLGALTTSNIVSWNLTLADSPTNSTLLTPGNSAFSSGNYNTGGQPNNDFTATSTTLTMTYSNGGFWSVSGASGQFCMTDWSNCFGPIAYGTWSINGDSAYSDSSVGAGSSQIIGTGGTVATPVTSTYVATGPIAAGTAMPGTLPWTMMAQAGAAGAASTTPGPVGPQGPAGPLGLTGATGATGLQGTIGLTGTTGAQGPAGPQGATGAMGAQGPIGFTGAQGPQGAPGTAGTNGTGFNWTGQWNATASYNINDTVSYNGTSYIAVSANTAQEPDLGPNMNFLMTSPIGPTGQPGNTAISFTLLDSPATTSEGCGNCFFLANQPTSVILNGVSQTLVPGSNQLYFLIDSGLGQVGGFIFQDTTGSFYAFEMIQLSGPTENIVTGCNTGSPCSPIFQAGTYSGVMDTGTRTPATLTMTPSPNSNWAILAQAGVAGVAGALGPQGPMGLTGAQGTTGQQGPIGLTGAQGPQGAQGAAGATGSQGLIGLTGATGPQGSVGAVGAVGATGTPGPIGVTGPQGPIGLTGANGAQGIQGIQGVTGPQGAIGPQGSAGNTPGHVALLQWWSSLTYPVGSGPAAVAFDGTNVWVTNQTSGSGHQTAGQHRSAARHLLCGNLSCGRSLRRN